MSQEAPEGTKGRKIIRGVAGLQDDNAENRDDGNTLSPGKKGAKVPPPPPPRLLCESCGAKKIGAFPLCTKCSKPFPTTSCEEEGEERNVSDQVQAAAASKAQEDSSSGARRRHWMPQVALPSKQEGRKVRSLNSEISPGKAEEPSSGRKEDPGNVALSPAMPQDRPRADQVLEDSPAEHLPTDPVDQAREDVLVVAGGAPHVKSNTAPLEQFAKEIKDHEGKGDVKSNSSNGKIEQLIQLAEAAHEVGKKGQEQLIVSCPGTESPESGSSEQHEQQAFSEQHVQQPLSGQHVQKASEREDFQLNSRQAKQQQQQDGVLDEQPLSPVRNPRQSQPVEDVIEPVLEVVEAPGALAYDAGVGVGVTNNGRFVFAGTKDAKCVGQLVKVDVGDEVISLNGTMVSGLMIDQVIRMWRGFEGTLVNVLVKKVRTDEEISASLVRKRNRTQWLDAGWGSMRDGEQDAQDHAALNHVHKTDSGGWVAFGDSGTPDSSSITSPSNTNQAAYEFSKLGDVSPTAAEKPHPAADDVGSAAFPAYTPKLPSPHSSPPQQPSSRNAPPPPNQASGTDRLKRSLEGLIAIGVTEPKDQASILGLSVEEIMALADVYVPTLSPRINATGGQQKPADAAPQGVTAQQLAAIGITDPSEQAEILRFATSSPANSESIRRVAQQQQHRQESAKIPPRKNSEAQDHAKSGLAKSDLAKSERPIAQGEQPIAMKDQDQIVEVNLDQPVSWGSFKSAYPGKIGDTPVSVLRYRNSEHDADVVRAASREVKILSLLPKHPNLNTYLGTLQPPGQGVCIVMELCLYGQLDCFLKNHKEKVLMSHRIAIVSQICDAMRVVCGCSVIHRDLAAHNVLVYGLKPLQVKVIDFGLAMREGSDSVVKARRLEDVFAVRWAAKEILDAHNSGTGTGDIRDLRAPWSFKSDVWAFGVTAWQVFAHGEVPYTLAMPDKAVIVHVRSGRRLGTPLGCPTEIFKSVMEPCWQEEPTQRPAFEHLWHLLVHLQKKYMA